MTIPGITRAEVSNLRTGRIAGSRWPIDCAWPLVYVSLAPNWVSTCLHCLQNMIL